MGYCFGDVVEVYQRRQVILAAMPLRLRALGQLPSYDGDAWVDWSWVDDHRADILDALRSHATVTFQVVALGVLVALPASLLAVNRPVLRGALLDRVGRALHDPVAGGVRAR